jgi:hypothetical protein
VRKRAQASHHDKKNKDIDVAVLQIALQWPGTQNHDEADRPSRKLLTCPSASLMDQRVAAIPIATCKENQRRAPPSTGIKDKGYKTIPKSGGLG